VPRAGGAATERARAKARRRRALPALAARGAGPVWLGAAVGLAAGLLAAWLLADVRALLLAGPLLVAVVTDLRERRIPNWLTLGGTVFALASAVPGVLALAALGAVVAGGAGLLLAIVARDGFGMGDVKLLAYGGAAVTLPSVPALLLATSLAGGALALAVLLERGPRRGLTMPFGPAIAAGCGWALLIR
jgi:prepilin peptidase CpaA